MEMSEVLCLKWNNHKSIFLQNLSSLRTQELYSDATITCSGKYFSVHRLVLSTCSEYFEQIFERINLQSIHPFIIVTNIEPGYLEALLNFMYNGEVNVLHEMLPGLIKAAEILKIKGLAVPDEEALEKELIYAREREASIPNKDTPVNHPKSPPRMSPIHNRSQTIIENTSGNCILPDDVTVHTTVVATSTPNEIPPIDPNMYQPKDEVVEMCPIESQGDYICNTQQNQQHIRVERESEIKLETDPLGIQNNETILPIPPPPPLPTPPIPSTPQQHFIPPPPAHVQQPLPPPLSPEINEMEEPDMPSPHYSPPPPTHQIYSSPPTHQGYTTSTPTHGYSKEGLKNNYDIDHSNAKCSTWEGTSNNKESDSSTAAAVMQEVIQGLFAQPEPETVMTTHENGGLPSNPRHTRPPIKQEELPTPPPPKPKVKKRNSSTSGPLNPSSKKCPKCSYVTKYVSTLRRHIMFKHTGEKPHKCHFCPYRSAHNFNMKKHMMIHTGEKPFSCPLCPYKAAQNSNIKSHMKSHEKKLLKAAIKETKKEKMQ